MLWVGHLLIRLTNPIPQTSKRFAPLALYGTNTPLTEPLLPRPLCSYLHPLLVCIPYHLLQELLVSHSLLTMSGSRPGASLGLFCLSLGFFTKQVWRPWVVLEQLVRGLSKDSKVKMREGKETGPS